METFNINFINIYNTIYIILFVYTKSKNNNERLILIILIFSVLPESARWMISKRRYQQAEELLRKIAKTNKRTFDEQAFEQLKNEQERVKNEKNFL